MAELRCNNCAYLKDDFCSKLNEALPTQLTKLFFGGAESILAGTVTFPSECGIEKQQKELQLLMLVPENPSESDEEEALLADPGFVVDNTDW